jgi:anti-sigma-K factor RskA
MTTRREAIAIRPEDERTLHAYHDGELGWLARRRFERRLRRSPALRRELEILARLGELAREADAEGPEPDLWERIALGLPAADAARAEASARRAGPPSWLGVPVAAAVAGVAAAVLVFGRGNGDTPPAGVVRWVDGRGSNVLVLEDAEASATIIWVLDAPEGDEGEEGDRDVA